LGLADTSKLSLNERLSVLRFHRQLESPKVNVGSCRDKTRALCAAFVSIQVLNRLAKPRVTGLETYKVLIDEPSTEGAGLAKDFVECHAVGSTALRGQQVNVPVEFSALED
jgi:hypothetical protein